MTTTFKTGVNAGKTTRQVLSGSKSGGGTSKSLSNVSITGTKDSSGKAIKKEEQVTRVYENGQRVSTSKGTNTQVTNTPTKNASIIKTPTPVYVGNSTTPSGFEYKPSSSTSDLTIEKLQEKLSKGELPPSNQIVATNKMDRFGNPVYVPVSDLIESGQVKLASARTSDGKFQRSPYAGGIYKDKQGREYRLNNNNQIEYLNIERPSVNVQVELSKSNAIEKQGGVSKSGETFQDAYARGEFDKLTKNKQAQSTQLKTIQNVQRNDKGEVIGYEDTVRQMSLRAEQGKVKVTEGSFKRMEAQRRIDEQRKMEGSAIGKVVQFQKKTLEPIEKSVGQEILQEQRLKRIEESPALGIKGKLGISAGSAVSQMEVKQNNKGELEYTGKNAYGEYLKPVKELAKVTASSLVYGASKSSIIYPASKFVFGKKTTDILLNIAPEKIEKGFSQKSEAGKLTPLAVGGGLIALDVIAPPVGAVVTYGFGTYGGLKFLQNPSLSSFTEALLFNLPAVTKKVGLLKEGFDNLRREGLEPLLQSKKAQVKNKANRPMSKAFIRERKSNPNIRFTNSNELIYTNKNANFLNRLIQSNDMSGIKSATARVGTKLVQTGTEIRTLKLESEQRLPSIKQPQNRPMTLEESRYNRMIQSRTREPKKTFIQIERPVYSSQPVITETNIVKKGVNRLIADKMIISTRNEALIVEPYYRIKGKRIYESGERLTINATFDKKIELVKGRQIERQVLNKEGKYELFSGAKENIARQSKSYPRGFGGQSVRSLNPKDVGELLSMSPREITILSKRGIIQVAERRKEMSWMKEDRKQLPLLNKGKTEMPMGENFGEIVLENPNAGKPEYSRGFRSARIKEEILGRLRVKAEELRLRRKGIIDRQNLFRGSTDVKNFFDNYDTGMNNNIIGSQSEMALANLGESIRLLPELGNILKGGKKKFKTLLIEVEYVKTGNVDITGARKGNGVIIDVQNRNGVFITRGESIRESVRVTNNILGEATKQSSKIIQEVKPVSKLQNKEVSRFKLMEEQKLNTKLGQGLSQSNINKSDVKIDLAVKQESLIDSISKQMQNQEQRNENKYDIMQKQSLEYSLSQKSVERQLEKQKENYDRLIERQNNRFKPEPRINDNRFRRFKPEEPEPTKKKKLPFIWGTGNKFTEFGGFVVEAKVKGKFKKVSKPLSKESALDFGSKLISESALRSFRLTRTNEQPIYTGQAKPFEAERFYKKKSGIYVQKSKYAISSEGEKREIQQKGVQARRMFSGSIFNNKSVRGSLI